MVGYRGGTLSGRYRCACAGHVNVLGWFEGVIGIAEHVFLFSPGG